MSESSLRDPKRQPYTMNTPFFAVKPHNAARWRREPPVHDYQDDFLILDADGPAFLRGIGGEDTFGTSYGGHEYFPQSSMFSDMPYYLQKNADNDDWQKLVGYRFFYNESIDFEDSIHFRFGARAHDIAATVYWYTAKPVRPYVKMPNYAERLPGMLSHRKYDISLLNTGRWSIRCWRGGRSSRIACSLYTTLFARN